MQNFRNNASLAGALFLLAIIVSIAGGALIEPLITTDNALAKLASNSTMISWAVALEFFNGIAVIGIAVLFYPVLRQHNQALALGYVGMRITEAVFYLAGAMIPLLLLKLAKDAALDVQMLALLIGTRSLIMEFAVPVFLGLGALLLYYSMYQSKRLPRFLSVWGLFSAVAMMVANIWQWGTAVQIALVMPILLNEIVMGVWLIVVGFKSPRGG